jgi:hypothetical protein
MNKTEEILKSIEVLNGWGDYNVKPDVDERIEDIWMIIKYDIHGDEYLLIGTRDGKKYLYGCYEHLKTACFYNYLREPKFFKAMDEHAEISNKIFFEFERAFKQSHMSFGYDRKYKDRAYAQRVFDNEIDYISNLIENCDKIIDYDNYKVDIKHWLELNGIDSNENLKKLSDTRFTNKIGDNKLVGIAGKIDASCYEYITVDDCDLICINGKTIDPNKIKKLCSTDEWGCDLYRINLKGFRQSKVGA